MKTETWVLYRCTHRTIAEEAPLQGQTSTEECGAFEYVAPGFPPSSVCPAGHILKMVPAGEYEFEGVSE